MKLERTMVVDNQKQLCDMMCGKTDDEHEFCLRCGRKLKSDESRMLGYGQTCYKKMLTDNSRKPLF